MIGSDPTCDIVIAEAGVSRNHLLIFQDDNGLFAVDQNSTNGSFINDQLLIAGLKNAISPPVTIYMGTVTVTIKSDEASTSSSNSSSSSESTDSRRKTSIKDFKSQPAAPSIYKRAAATSSGDKTVVLKLERPKPATKFKFNPMYVVAGLVILAGAYFTQFTSEEEVQTAPSLKPRPRPVPLVAAQPIGLENVKLPEKDKILALSKNPKCAKSPETELCKSFKIPPNSPSWGVVSEEKNLFVFLPIDTAVGLVKDQLKTEITPKELTEIALAQGILYSTAPDIRYAELKGYQIIYAFFEKGEAAEPQLKAAALISPENLQSMRVIMGRLLGRLKQTGPKGVEISRSIYRSEIY
jgi:hypothetical protein